MKDFSQDPLTLGIIGAGIMGRGIAQVAATAGIKVIINDVNAAATEDAMGFVHKMIDRAVEKGRMQEDEAKVSKAKLQVSTSLADLKEADVVIEAIIEKLEIKQPLFKELEAIVSEDCILATNTSSLSVTAVATACEKQTRVAGCHFFNPVPLMKLVEVIGGVKTELAVTDQLVALVKRMGHTPVVVNDSPGFLVNHMGRGLNTEGLRILSEGIANAQDVDAVMRECVGFRMGPFELMDLTALDVTCPVSEQIYEQYYQEPRLRPTPMLRQRYVGGVLGKKVGEGFYKYTEGKKVEPEVATAPVLSSEVVFWVSPAMTEFHSKLVDMLKTVTVKIDDGERPQEDSIAIVTPLGQDCTSLCLDEDLNPEQTVAVDALFCSDKRLTLMSNPATKQEVIHSAWAAFARTNRAVTVIRDSAGLIAQRIVANIINTVSDIAQQGVARPQDIDTAAQLGLGYPKGPLTLADEIGSGTVLEILENLQAIYGDPRYRPSIWLRRRAMLGLSLLQTEFVEGD